MIENKIFFNRYFDKNRLKALILWSLTETNEKKTIDLVENLKTLGFLYATKAGLSLSIDDLKIPPTKSKLIFEAEQGVQISESEYNLGNITIIEKSQQLIDNWHRTSEILKQHVIEHFKSTDILNPVYMMAFSGARGNISQVRQLVGMRGLMADPQGQILDFPIRSNFREGLTLTEYVISCYGARKGLVDTALRTANSGYLTRRLIDVAQHLVIKYYNCKTIDGIFLKDMKDGKKIIFSLEKRLIGRVLAETIPSIAKQNQIISPSLAFKISQVRNRVLVRSPLSCALKNAICQLCYGWSLAHGNLVSKGEAVGILAAQSIGEPGTQLTMRTFHTGGVFSGDVMQEIRAPFSGIIKYENPVQGRLIRTLHGKIAFLTKKNSSFQFFNPITFETNSYTIPACTILFSRHFEKIEKGQLIAEYSSLVTKRTQRIQARYNVRAPLAGEMYFEDVLLATFFDKDENRIRLAVQVGSMVILEGNLYPWNIKFFPKSGDLIDQKSIFQELVLINKKTNYLGNGESYFSQKQSTNIKNLIKPKKLLFKKGPFSIHYKNIYYKNFGYFLSFSNQNQYEIFLSTGLKEKKYFLKKFSFYCFQHQSISKKQLDSNLLLPFYFVIESNSKQQKFSLRHTISKNYEIKNIFQIQNFLVQFPSLSEFIIPLKLKKEKNDWNNQILVKSRFTSNQSRLRKIIPSKTVKKKFNDFSLLLIKKDTILFNIKNKQGNRIPFIAKQRSLLWKKDLIILKKNCFYIELICQKKLSKNESLFLQKSAKLLVAFKNSKKNPFFLISKKSIILKTNFHQVNSFSLSEIPTRRKIRKYNFSSKKYLQIWHSNLAVKRKKVYQFEKNNELTFELNCGWFLLVKPLNTNLFNHKNLQIDNSKFTLYSFEHYFIYKKLLFTKKSISFFFKKKYLAKTRFIQNNLFQLKNPLNSKEENKIEKKLQTSFVEKQKNLSLKSSPKVNSRIFLSFPQEKGVSTLLFFSIPNSFKQSLKRISRNNLYSSNLKIKNLTLHQIQKPTEINNFFQDFQKDLFNQLTLKKYFPAYQKTSFFDNKQTMEINIKKSLDFFVHRKKSIFNTSKQNSFFKPVNISFFAGNQNKKNLQINWEDENILKIWNIEKKFFHDPGNSMKLNFQTEQTKLVLGQKNQIIAGIPWSVSYFFSPLQGEILTIKSTGNENQKGLILTNNQKISFSYSYCEMKKKSNLQLGKIVRYGQQLENGLGIPVSGQIFSITKDNITLRKALPILFSKRGVFHIENRDLVEKNTPLITLFYQKVKTEDIVQGIPKIEELFEARQSKKGSTNLHIQLERFFQSSKYNYLQKHTPQKYGVLPYAARRSIRKIQQRLVNNVQNVYQSQGVSIADKHIEIIVRQMTTKVKITYGGKTGFLYGELKDLETIDSINRDMQLNTYFDFEINKYLENWQTNHEKADLETGRILEVENVRYEPIILGITKAALETESFISAASFQETTRILSRAGIEKQSDFLKGLKENVILGHVIPAGTGFRLPLSFRRYISMRVTKIGWFSYKEVIQNYSSLKITGNE